LKKIEVLLRLPPFEKNVIAWYIGNLL
jgi:hypothetical protein